MSAADAQCIASEGTVWCTAEATHRVEGICVHERRFTLLSVEPTAQPKGDSEA